MVIEYSQKELMEIIIKDFNERFDYKFHATEQTVSFDAGGKYICARVRVNDE